MKFDVVKSELYFRYDVSIYIYIFTNALISHKYAFCLLQILKYLLRTAASMVVQFLK